MNARTHTQYFKAWLFNNVNQTFREHQKVLTMSGEFCPNLKPLHIYKNVIRNYFSKLILFRFPQKNCVFYFFVV
jgi:hypothetical protein